jgi:predicted RNA binding protein YcfA (HicA-like mRNA interferase family)
VPSGREVCVILAANGFEQVRQRGSHIVMQKRSGRTTITLPVPDHAEMRPCTLLSIIRHSGLPRKLSESEESAFSEIEPLEA